MVLGPMFVLNTPEENFSLFETCNSYAGLQKKLGRQTIQHTVTVPIPEKSSFGMVNFCYKVEWSGNSMSI
jgi:hypothetical protein